MSSLRSSIHRSLSSVDWWWYELILTCVGGFCQVTGLLSLSAFLNGRHLGAFDFFCVCLVGVMVFIGFFDLVLIYAFMDEPDVQNFMLQTKVFKRVPVLGFLPGFILLVFGFYAIYRQSKAIRAVKQTR